MMASKRQGISEASVTSKETGCSLTQIYYAKCKLKKELGVSPTKEQLVHRLLNPKGVFGRTK